MKTTLMFITLAALGAIVGNVAVSYGGFAPGLYNTFNHVLEQTRD